MAKVTDKIIDDTQEKILEGSDLLDIRRDFFQEYPGQCKECNLLANLQS